MVSNFRFDSKVYKDFPFELNCGLCDVYVTCKIIKVLDSGSSEECIDFTILYLFFYFCLLHHFWVIKVILKFIHPAYIVMDTNQLFFSLDT